MLKPKKIPSQPGVYIFKNRQGTPIYVGKAVNLRHRLKTYFNQRLTGKNKLILETAYSVKWQTVSSEFAALLLEAKLIKKFKPKYNARWKDDKRYPSIAISIKEKFPRVYFTRERNETQKHSQVLFFGPFPSPQRLKEVLIFLRNIFPFRSCKNLPQKPCLYYHLKLCPGVCTHHQENYKSNINSIIKILKGWSKGVLQSLKKKMHQAARNLEYEKAAKLKKQILSLQSITTSHPSSKLNSLLFCDRVEGYDIANIQGKQASGSMVVFKNQKPSKSDYRRFKIKTVSSANDPAMIAEILKRRFNHPEWPSPDMILVDGGQAQVSAALKILQGKNLDIPVVGLAKEKETLLFKEKNRWQKINLPQSSPILQLFQRVRDEAHRFAQTYHHHLRLKGPFTAFLLFLALLPLPTNASENFAIKQAVTYDVRQDGLTYVQQDVSLTNQTSDFYATRYNLTINTLKITNFQARDDLGPLKANITQFGESTEIELIFNQKVTGLGQTLSFSFNYQTPAIASFSGRILEVNLPKIENLDELSDFQVTLQVPKELSQSAFFQPQPTQKSASGPKTSFLFTKDSLTDGKIKATFGEYQVFQFTLLYHLANPETSPVEVQIAFPPDTAYQNIFYDKIAPQPADIEKDPDGNWLGLYHLTPGENFSVTAAGFAQVFSQPQYSQSLSAEEKKNLISSQKYWPAQDQQIISLANGLTNAQAIYDFTLSRLDYDYERIKINADRLGPLAALNNQKGLCLEFTDLFVTLARAKGIPARSVNGYAYSKSTQVTSETGKDDILHAWPEYYDEEKQTWLSVDPTWGETTQGIDFFHRLDFNHFAFALHGHDSELPPAAGSYKQEDTQGSDLNIQFSLNLPQSKQELQIKLDLPDKIIAGFPQTGTIKVKNTGNRPYYHQTLKINSSPLKISRNDQFEIAFFAPFAEKTFPVSLLSPHFFNSGTNILVASFAQFSAQKEVSVISLIHSKITLIILLIVFLLTFILILKNLKPRQLNDKIN